MIRYTADFLCLGAIHTDYNMYLNKKYLTNRTNPVIVKKNLGGVAYNISKYLRMYSKKVELNSLKINDNQYKILKKQRINFNEINNKNVERSYISVLNAHGKMVFGLANTSAYECINHNVFNKKLLKNKTIILDLNFSKKLIENIIEKNFKKNMIMVCGTSAAKIKKIKNLLNKIDVLALNNKEILTLTNTDNIVNAIKIIRKKNKNITIGITNGSKKILCIHNNKFYEGNCPKVKIKNENGAGDAFTAIFFGEISIKSSIDRILKNAITAGSLSARGIKINNIEIFKKKLFQIAKKIRIKEKKIHEKNNI